jgi:hypothetical protein
MYDTNDPIRDSGLLCDALVPATRAYLQLQSGALSANQRLAIIGKFLLYLRKTVVDTLYSSNT